MRSTVVWFKRILLKPPELRSRIVCALVLGAFGAVLIHREYTLRPAFHSDFGLAWYGARSMIARTNPYPMVGPGLAFDFEWKLLYPATAFIAVLPIAWLPEKDAATIFVGVSTFLVAFAITRQSWHLLPLFSTEAFASSARLGQWSLLLTAGLFLPWVASISLAKPQMGVPLLATSRSKTSYETAAIGSLVLLTLSLILLPGWIDEWFRLIRAANHMQPPISHFGGFIVLLVLLKWRRPESWLVLGMACIPQTWGWYNTLPLFTLPATFVEAVIMAGVATVGGYLGATAVPSTLGAAQFYDWVGSLLIFSIYVPAVILILRRPNEGPSPLWLTRILATTRRKPD